MHVAGPLAAEKKQNSFSSVTVSVSARSEIATVPRQLAQSWLTENNNWSVQNNSRMKLYTVDHHGEMMKKTEFNERQNYDELSLEDTEGNCQAEIKH